MRTASSHGAPKRDTVDLTDSVRTAVEASRARINEREHELSVSLLEGPVCVNGDPIWLEQIVSNPLENAVKYTGAGGGRIAPCRVVGSRLGRAAPARRRTLMGDRK